MKHLVKRLMQRRYRGVNERDRQISRLRQWSLRRAWREHRADAVEYLLIREVPWLTWPAHLTVVAQPRVVCAACVSFDYKPEFVRITYSNLTSVQQGLESDIGDVTAHANAGSAFLAAHTLTINRDYCVGVSSAEAFMVIGIFS